MARTSGFFNSLKTTTGYDRKVGVNDFSNMFAAIIRSGVLRTGDNDLRVTANGAGMNLTIGIGWGFILGRWFHNDTIFTGFSVPTAPTGDRARIDRVVLRFDNTLEIRNVDFKYLTGTQSQSPTPPEITRNNNIYDIVLADILVNPNVVTINQSNITDQRPNKELCGWITTPVGYDDYFEALDAEFNEWLQSKKDQLASSTLFKQYHWHVTISEETTQVLFNIPQYDPTGVDIIQVFVNGILEIEETDYTLNNSLITFNTTKIVGTDVDIFCYKSIDGEGLGSVSDEITELQNQAALVKNIGEYIYICNGVDDNIKLSEIAEEFLNGGDDYSQLVISVYGNFKNSVPFAGAGSSSSRYRWLNLGLAGATKRKITFDFAGCNPITFDCSNSYYYIGVYGANLNIKNATFIANHKNASGSFEMFSASTTSIIIENCRFYLNGDASIGKTGTFNNCYAEVNHLSNEGSQTATQLFSVRAGSLLKLNGGEYYVYGNSSDSYIINAVGAGAIVCNEVNAPSVSKASYTQGQFFKNNSGNTCYATFNDCITLLSFDRSDADKIIVNNKIPLSLPNRG